MTIAGKICLVLVIVLLVILGYVGYKYYNLRKHMWSKTKKMVDKMGDKYQDTLTEINKREISVNFKEKQMDIDYKKFRDNLESDYAKKREVLTNEFEKKIEVARKEYEEKAEADSKALNEALEEQEQKLILSIQQVDEMIENKIKSLTIDNTILFDCVCGKQNIPCYIALNKENTFRCDKCNTVYAVNVKFSPVRIGTATNEEEFNKVIEARLQEEENGEII